MKVLVVDDDVVSRMMLMHLVDGCGRYEILEAEDGLDAWRQFEAGLRPAITFCDLRMPHLSGTELLVRVKANPALAAMPFVLVSAANDSATMDETVQLGADGYVVKPFRVEQLRPHLIALEADETPAACAARLGVDLARLALYFSGLDRQLAEAGPVLDDFLAAGDAAGAGERLARLREGCAPGPLRGGGRVRACGSGAAPGPCHGGIDGRTRRTRAPACTLRRRKQLGAETWLSWFRVLPAAPQPVPDGR
ncbi:response regulator [Massilia sp. Se16.2.3]|uniref:response regulator n=1 Tax=Massilia sp. Se16.2.3 TaxID=2709303 RepID=UPI00160119C4|nr:response regulator [Massilia sp. Se16.2.3]QNA99310.1 response regulator [Massilia sp. Se16.2.3]